jgi:hypothetical protein
MKSSTARFSAIPGIIFLFAWEVHDLPRLGELKVVMRRLRHRPQHARIAVELEEPE